MTTLKAKQESVLDLAVHGFVRSIENSLIKLHSKSKTLNYHAPQGVIDMIHAYAKPFEAWSPTQANGGASQNNILVSSAEGGRGHGHFNNYGSICHAESATRTWLTALTSLACRESGIQYVWHLRIVRAIPSGNSWEIVVGIAPSDYVYSGSGTFLLSQHAQGYYGLICSERRIQICNQENAALIGAYPSTVKAFETTGDTMQVILKLYTHKKWLLEYRVNDTHCGFTLNVAQLKQGYKLAISLCEQREIELTDHQWRVLSDDESE